jgi:hypothetical protein
LKTVIVGSACALAIGAQPLTQSLAAQAQESPKAAASADSSEVLAPFTAAWSALASYSTTITIYERKGTKEENHVLAYHFEKPADVSVHVVSGSSNAGTTVTWAGGPTVSARGAGLASMFRKTLSLHDPQVMSIRGESLDELSFGSILAHARQQDGKITQTTALVDGVQADEISMVPSQPLADGGLTREVVDLSPVTHLPVCVLGYEGAVLVRKIDFSKVSLTN